MYLDHKDGLQTNNWANSDSIVNYISKFQNKYGQKLFLILRRLN